MVAHDGRRVRRIEAATCEEAVDALALIAALIIERDSETPKGEASVRPHRDTLRTKVTRARTRTEEPGTRAEPTRATTERDKPEAPTAPAAMQPPTPTATQPPKHVDERDTETTPRALAERPAVTDARGRHYAPYGELFASTLVASGIAPALRAGVGLEGALGFSSGALELALRLGVRVALPHTARSDQGEARFAWASGIASLCAGARARRVFSGAGCFAAELGRISARGSDTDGARKARPQWSGFGPALRLALRPHGRLLVAATAAALASGARDSFSIGERELHRVPPLTFRCELGIGMLFE